MDVDSKINNFEIVLMGYSATKSLLYKDKNIKQTGDELQSVDVIKNVSKQIKAINNDETQKKTTSIKLRAYKKFNFIPVNMLSQESKPGTSNNFETQYVFDTQLLTVIKDAEVIIDKRTGFTQEFETSFEQIIDSKKTEVNKVLNTNSQCNKIQSNSENVKENFASQSEPSEELFARNHNYLWNDKQRKISDKLFNKNSNSIDAQNELKICTVQNFNVSESKERSLSPILYSKKSSCAHKSSSITCMLESFEKFEAIAGPIVQENSSLESAKRIINSQILSHKLFKPDHRDHSNDGSGHLSPILKIKSEIREIEKLVIPDAFEEEILFSSDDESDYMRNQIKELPLTCALETSFYEQLDVLNKTMYVGFQTASNKSIQVLTNSFSKAKSIFNNIYNDNKESSNTLSLSELVEVYDSTLKQKNDVKEVSCLEQMDDGQKLENDKHKLNIIVKNCSVNEMQVGFQTDESPDKVEANISAVVNVSHFDKNQKHINNTVRDVPEKDILFQTGKAASCTSNIQEQINIDDSMMREFEESLLCINDNKLHTNFDIVNHPLNMDTNDCKYNSICVSKNIAHNNKNINERLFQGFKTASNKPINISEEALKKTNKIFEELDLQSELTDKDMGKVKCNEKSSKVMKCNDKKIEIERFQGFKTASYNPINISEEAILKYNKIFQESDFQSDLTDEDVDKAKCNEKSPKVIIYNDKKIQKGCFQGFKTASNNPINISEEALLKLNKILQEFDVNSDFADHGMNKAKCNKQFSKDVLHNDKNTSKELFQVFETASNKLINISEEALVDINKILQEIGFLSDLTDDNMNINERLFQGFKTASNKPINISEEALKKTNKIFEELDLQSELTDKDMGKVKCNEKSSKVMKCNDKKIEKERFQGFKTASNNPINISEEAILKYNKIFQESDFQSDLTDEDVDKAKCNEKSPKVIIYNDKKIQKGCFQGFKTASNNPINISEEALLKRNKILQEFDVNSDFADHGMKQAKCNKQFSKDVLHNDKNTSKELFQVFETASNKLINISEEALVDSNKILQEIDFQSDLTDDNMNINERLFQGFKTASNKPINISEEALKKTNKIFEELDLQSELTDKDMGKVKCNEKSSKVMKCNDKKIEKERFQGFKTASNNPINISEEAILKYNKIFQESDFQSDLTDEDVDKAKCNEKSPKVIIYNDKKIQKGCFQGFKTASNNPINISEEALLKRNKILQEFDVNSDFADHGMKQAKCNKQFSKDVLHNDKNTSKELFQVFETASNKLINISEEALVDSNKILQEIDFQSDLTDDNMNINERLFQGFKTASNKPINISEEALKKTNKIFEELDLQSELTDKDMGKVKCNEKSSKVMKCNDKKIEKERFQGFKTASNNPINISEEAILKYNKIFQESDFQSILTDEDMGKAKCTNKNSEDITHYYNETQKGFYQGFATASNNPINISKGALAKSKRILAFDEIDINIDADFTEKEANNSSENKNLVEGFTTASSKRVKISKEALNQSKYVFEDIPLQDHDNLSILEAPNKAFKVNSLIAQRNEFQGFKTANNNLVKISKEALAKSKNLFQDINNENILPDKQMNKSTNCKIIGFQTANNEDVSISEEALRKSKKIFEDIDVNLKKGIKQKLKNDDNIAFKTPNNNSAPISKIGELFADADMPVSHNHLKTNYIDNIIDTEMMVDFEETKYTEDFINGNQISKRPGSPILSFLKAKKSKIRTNNEINLVDQKVTKMIQYEFNTSYKKNKKYKLLDIYQTNNESDKSESHQVIKFDIDNILNYEFVGVTNEISNVRWSTDNIKQYFLESVNKKIIPEGWIENHMKLIILKLISYEKRFPSAMPCVCSVNNVMEQLKYRYDRELYNVERPALRKILEKNEVPYRRMVLNVLNIYIDGVSITNATDLTENIELLLSDGWYCVKATIDKMLVKLVREGKIVVGTKLITQGAELLNCEQGVAPWEDTSSVRLKIFGNSTRRMHWAARLGFHGNGAILSYLTSVKPDGGKVSQLRVVVTRVYPLLYVEKFDDGSTVTRSERLENLHQMKYETEREILLEKVYEDVEKEFSNQDSQDYECMDIGTNTLESGSQIYQQMKKSRDPVEFSANLPQSQAKLLQEYTVKRRDVFFQNIQAKVQDLLNRRGLNVARNVVPMLKMRVADVYRNNVTKATITVWRPNESLLHLFQEGSWVDIFNVVATAVRYSEIQISAGKQSVFRKTLKVQDQMANIAKSFQRKCYMISELTQNPFMTTDYNEIDTVGFVFDIEPSVKEFDSKKQLFQNVFLADVNKRVICINFWGGLKKFGFENMFETGHVVACVNLQKRSGNSRKNIPQYRATEFSYFTKTPKIDTCRNFFDDLSKHFLSLDRRKFIQDCIVIKNNFVNIKYGNIENISPYRFNNSDYNISKNKAFINSPIGEINLNLNWLDFESTFKQTNTELSPKRLLRKKEINEKIARLQKYGEPPPLSSIRIVNKNKDAAKAYKSPLLSNISNPTNQRSLRRDNTYVATKPLILNVETTPNATNLNASSDKTKSSNNQCPVLPYRRRTVNPVKLNFSKQNDITEDDPFGEDFESSPPLSLD